MQFGYIVIFGWSDPLIAVLAISFMQIDINANLSKLLFAVRRPINRTSNGIGIWYYIMEFYCIIAVLTNTCFLIMHAYKNDKTFFPEFSVPTKIGAAIVAEHLAVFLKTLIHMGISNVPESIKRHRAKENLLLLETANAAFTSSSWPEPIFFFTNQVYSHSSVSKCDGVGISCQTTLQVTTLLNRSFDSSSELKK